MHRAAVKRWQKKNPDKTRSYTLKRKFGITGEDYEKLLCSQQGRCAICQTDKCSSGRRFAVDHCHETGKVRGLLCKDCNLLIGRAKDKPRVLKAAATYLEVNEWKPPVASS